MALVLPRRLLPRFHARRDAREERTRREGAAPLIRAVTLDFFQTLARHGRGDGGRGGALMAYLASQGLATRPWEHRILYDVLEPHAREYAPDASAEAKRAYHERLAGRVFEALGVTGDPAPHARAIWDLLGPSSLAPYPDVSGALTDLRARGYRLAVVSNWQCGLGHFCVELGLAAHFEVIVASAEVGWEKPDPRIFHEAAARLGLAPDRILHVGDSPVDDVEGARAAGFAAVLLDREGRAAAPDARTIRGLAQLPPLLDRWSARPSRRA